MQLICQGEEKKAGFVVQKRRFEKLSPRAQNETPPFKQLQMSMSRRNEVYCLVIDFCGFVPNFKPSEFNHTCEDPA